MHNLTNTTDNEIDGAELARQLTWFAERGTWDPTLKDSRAEIQRRNECIREEVPRIAKEENTNLTAAMRRYTERHPGTSFDTVHHAMYSKRKATKV